MADGGRLADYIRRNAKQLNYNLIRKTPNRTFAKHVRFVLFESCFFCHYRTGTKK